MAPVKKTICIDEEDYNKAVAEVTRRNAEDPKYQENPLAAMMLSLSGVAFAAQLHNVLFKEDNDHE